MAAVQFCSQTLVQGLPRNGSESCLGRKELMVHEDHLRTEAWSSASMSRTTFFISTVGAVA